MNNIKLKILKNIKNKNKKIRKKKYIKNTLNNVLVKSRIEI